jgi:hypothetical protein
MAEYNPWRLIMGKATAYTQQGIKKVPKVLRQP